jgi:hypothetical protein
MCEVWGLGRDKKLEPYSDEQVLRDIEPCARGTVQVDGVAGTSTLSVVMVDILKILATRGSVRQFPGFPCHIH